jgi:Rod binding domain-containing protein
MGKDILPLRGAPAAPQTDRADKRDPKMVEAAKGFEQQFVRQMISEMRKTVPESEFMPDSMASRVFKDQLDDHYAETWTDQGGIGLADMIYEQLAQKYGPVPEARVGTKVDVKPLKQSSVEQTVALGHPDGRGAIDRPKAGGGDGSIPLPQDVLSRADRSLFLVKEIPRADVKSGGMGLILKSKEPLPENVSLRAPLAGKVFQAQTLEDGRKVISIEHDQGLVSQFVHTGRNTVTLGHRVAAGEAVLELPKSRSGEGSRVFFELRKSAKTE